MKVKIATYALILKNPVFDKKQLTSELIKNGFEKKYFEIKLMKAYRMDGTEIPNKANLDAHNKKYSLLGKSCSVAFVGDEILLHHKFGISLSEITYVLDDVLNEIKSIMHTLKKFSNLGSKEFELILLLKAIGTKNPQEIIEKIMKKNQKERIVSGICPDSETSFLEGVDKMCTKENIQVQNGEYVIELRFQSDESETLCNVLRDSEKIGRALILEIESKN